MSTLILFCVFGIAPGNSGLVRQHAMTPNEIDHLADIQLRADHATDPASYEIAALRAYEVRLCRSTFGMMPDLVWTKGGRQ